MREMFHGAGIQANAEQPKQKIRVALQGGGTLGAYAAGVLDILDQQDDIEIDQMGGPSAAAVNTGVYAVAGREGLDTFWNRIGRAGSAAHVINLFDPLQITKMVNESYLMNGWRASGALEDVGPQGFLAQALTEVIGSHHNLRKSPIDMRITTVSKINPRGDLSPDNLQEHVHTNEDLTIKKIVASGALQELGPVRIDGRLHWDGAYSGGNPSFDTFDHHPEIPLVVVTVDRPEVMRSTRDPALVYGRVHGEIHDLRKQGRSPIYQIALEQPETWDESVRTNPLPSIINELREQGQQDALAFLQQLRHDMNPQRRLQAAVGADYTDHGHN